MLGAVGNACESVTRTDRRVPCASTGDDASIKGILVDGADAFVAVAIAVAAGVVADNVNVDVDDDDDDDFSVHAGRGCNGSVWEGC